MENRALVITAILVTLILRLVLVSQGGEIGLEGYETLTHAQHIADTGLPLTHSELSWQGATKTTMPLFYYLIAIGSIFVGLKTAALYIPNILMATLPFIIYLLAKEITRNRFAVAGATLASAFAPLLYAETIHTASPVSLAIPLLFLAYYLFIRLSRTAKDQSLFALVVVLLTLTHPISIILIPAMGITLLFTHIQKTRFSYELAEATIFSTFLIIWANSIIYKYALQHYGIEVFWLTTTEPLTIPMLATFVGVVPLLAGMYAAMKAFSEEKNVAIHAIIALLGTSILSAALGFVPVRLALLIISILLIILLAPALELLLAAKRRSRIPGVHTTMLLVGMAAFILTSAVPAVALGLESASSIPSLQEKKTVEVLQATITDGPILWDAQHGAFLEYYGVPTALHTNVLSSPNSLETIADLKSIFNTTSEIRLIDELNEYNVQGLVLPPNHNLPLGERCFEIQFRSQQEVYELRCVVQ